ncbi:hypothetical protein JTE90_001179 [Oedothorax gibbosus]|uniref:Uncharacterized protein n=1 Tax=Oedothorax gibbosus TaxID=931172 RepID=A0AAV6TG05_9ARAC|nr:hypothetical protein JTE90_001179 [Oedothorax gibbosus]
MVLLSVSQSERLTVPFVHPTAPVLLTKSGAHWALSGHPVLVRPSNPDPDIDLARQNRYGPPPEFPLALVLSGHSSPSSGQRVRSNSATCPKWNAAVSLCAPPARERGSRCGEPPPACTFIRRQGLSRPMTRALFRLLGPCSRRVRNLAAYGPRTPRFGHSPGPGDLRRIPSPASLLLNASISPHALASGYSAAGLPPGSIAVTKGILLVSFPPLYFMLNSAVISLI